MKLYFLEEFFCSDIFLLMLQTDELKVMNCGVGAGKSVVTDLNVCFLQKILVSVLQAH